MDRYGGIFMKKIVYNYDNLDERDINRVVKRAKVILINDRDEVLLCNCNNDYHFIGGHVCGDESDFDCLQREILEEIGVNIEFPFLKPIVNIKYLNKDYPGKGINTMSIANYYVLRKNVEPSYKNINLTDEEKEGNFYFRYVKMDDVIMLLLDSIENASRKGVVYDTIEAFLEYKRCNIDK